MIFLQNGNEYHNYVQLLNKLSTRGRKSDRRRGASRIVDAERERRDTEFAISLFKLLGVGMQDEVAISSDGASLVYVVESATDMENPGSTHRTYLKNPELDDLFTKSFMYEWIQIGIKEADQYLKSQQRIAKESESAMNALFT